MADLRETLADEAPPPVASEAGALVQVADADAVCGPDHLRSAARHAVASRARGDGVADDPAMDVLLYAAGVRQITDALATVGLSEGDEAIGAVAVHPDPEAVLDRLAADLGGTRDDALLEASEQALEALGLPAAQREAVPRDRWTDLALEQVALLEVDR